MERVTVYLRNSLFSFGGEGAHIPAGVMVIEARVVDGLPGGLTLDVERMLDARGGSLSENEITLHLPWAKVDHVAQRA